ncbi:response regulator transcription factor [Eggerthellaceae bacterium zg-1084]|uniref:Response regulator transcription factor n=2 Tax=Berryella wangjianweii TaxID=2734634 RepID=A0A6M8J3D6_9ACTN|nr:response regulator transcription factor [Berryella wangjianweii]NPD32090.1 response regulator transcription factor [Eggerthellaceae bacterium zg-997]QKF08014.1 response regulator transcription factor [Berryella wangjianweii]
MLVDDDESMRELVGQIAQRHGWRYRCAADGAQAAQMIAEKCPDLLILDVMLPDVNGFQICADVRAAHPRLPIMFLSAKGDIVDKSVGFNAGADDYLVKPFLGEELVLRVNAQLRRRQREHAGSADAQAREGEWCETGELRVCFGKYEVYLRGCPVSLSSREFELLALLASDVGTVFTRDQIIKALWDDASAADPNTVTVLVRKIREKIEDDPARPRYLTTVWRVGYKLNSL